MLRGAGAKAGQRVSLSDLGRRKHRADQGLRREEGGHHLPALLQHPVQGLQGSRLRIEVEHYTVFLERLLGQDRLKFKTEAFDCTYHDSCYLGRYNDIFEAPRALLQAAGGSIAEMVRSGNESFCCGAGGGRILAEENLGSRINIRRVNMAAETGSPDPGLQLPLLSDHVRGRGQGSGAGRPARAQGHRGDSSPSEWFKRTLSTTEGRSGRPPEGRRTLSPFAGFSVPVVVFPSNARFRAHSFAGGKR